MGWGNFGAPPNPPCSSSKLETICVNASPAMAALSGSSLAAVCVEARMAAVSDSALRSTFSRRFW